MLKAASVAAALAAAAVCAAGCDQTRSPVPSAAGGGGAALLPGAAVGRGAPAREGEILVGEVGPLTGPEASLGESTHRGVELALRRVNARGGVKGRRLKVKQVDDQGWAERAARATERLVIDDHAVLVLGEVTGAGSRAMAEVAERLKVPMISHAATDPRVTEGRAYVFRVCFTDVFQGGAMARFARERLQLDRVALLEDPRGEDSAALARFFAARFKAAGGRIVERQAYAAGAADLAAQLSAIEAAGAQALFVPGPYSDVARIARQARARGLSIPLLGAGGWSTRRLVAEGGEAVEGSFFTDHYSTQDPSPRTQEFVAAYRAAYGAEPDSFAALGYDAMRVAAHAIARARSLAGDDLRDAVATTRGFEGVTGPITIDAAHEVAKPAVVLGIEGGRAVYRATVAP